MSERKNIAIIGAGFGGLRTALLIGKKIKKLELETRYRVTLIDRNDYHTYTPTLYEFATNDPEHTSYTQLREMVTLNLHQLTSNLPIEVINATVSGIDTKKSVLTFAERDPLSFEYLVLAPGSEPNYFDIPGLEKHATPLKTFRDSIEIREYILDALHQKPEPIDVVVGGGGSAGVELAGEVRSWLNKIQMESKGARQSRVSVIETAPTVLAQFPQSVTQKAMRRLARIGVKTIVNERIASVRDNLISLATGKNIPFDVLVWTGGIKPSTLIANLAIAKEPRGRVLVSETMECSPAEHAPMLGKKIFALGDIVFVMNPKTKQPIPQTAHAALVQANVVAHNLVEDIRLREGVGSEPAFRVFTPKDYPYIIPIGGKFAIARIGPLVISGLFGWILKGVVELMYLASLMPFAKAFSLCVRGLRIIIKNDRVQ